ncbi:MAG: hypothetical protein M0Z67_06350 [Nitrospiraceae bacterium]|nr:hypothetical protein [Nitrospiraceae bacterium]
MSILPEGEQLRRAIKWISDQQLENPKAGLPELIGEACLKFDLSPKDSDLLVNFYADMKKGKRS